MESSQSNSPSFLAEDKSNELVSFAIALGIIEAVFVGLYFISRLKKKAANGWDVYLMLPAFVFCFSLVVSMLLLVKYGGDGHHMAAVSAKKLVIWFKMEVAVIFLYFPAVTLPKLSILCLYLRICTTRSYRIATYSIGGLLVLIAVVLTSVSFALCVPFSYNWDKAIPGGHCLNQVRFYTWVGLPNIVTDVAMIILPLPLVWQLQTSRGQKIGLTVTFLTGSIGIITAIMRFVVFNKPGIFADLTWTTIEPMIWTATEPGAYLIAACLPSLRFLLKPLSKTFSSRSFRTWLLDYRSKQTVTGNSGRDETMLKDRTQIHLKRLGDPLQRSLEDGSDERGLVACYRSRDSQESDGFTMAPTLAKTAKQQPSPGITVQKTYSLSIKPAAGMA